MKISKVRMEGFGKFLKRDFSFQAGLNVIFGPNESGKTTLADFILYTLSGFSAQEIERYRPWNGEEFSGKIVLEIKTGDKVELSLDPSNPSEERYLKRTEYELTSYVPEDSGLNLERGMNGVMIARLKRRMEEMKRIDRIIQILDLNQELYEKMRKIEEELRAKIEELRSEIGDLERQLEEELSLRRRYVENRKRLKELQRELEKQEKLLMAARISKARSTWKDINDIRMEISNLGLEISALKKYTKIDRNMINKVYELESEIKNLQGRIDDLGERIVGEEDDERALENRMKRLREKLRIDKDGDLDRIELKLKNLKLVLRMYREKISEIGEIKEEWKIFENTDRMELKMAKLEDMVRNITQFEDELEKYRENMRRIDERMEKISKSVNTRNVLTGMFIGIAAVLSIVGIYLQRTMWFGIGSGVMAGIALAIFLSSLELRKRRYSLEDELTRDELNVRVIERKLDAMKRELEQELEELGFESFDALKEEYKSFEMWKEKVKEVLRSEAVLNLENELREGLKEFYGEVIGDYEALINDLEKLLNEYRNVKKKYDLIRLSRKNMISEMEDLKMKKNALEKELNEILEKLECKSVRDCDEIEKGLKRYEELTLKRSSLEEKLRKLRNEWEKLKVYFDMEMPEDVDESHLEPEEIISSRMENIKLEISEIEKRILELIGRIKEVEVKPEDYFHKLETMADLEIKLEKVSTEISIFPEVITLLSEMKDEFIERYKSVFEEKLGEIMIKLGLKEIAIDVRDDLSLEVKVIGGKGGIGSLSKATRDQLELAYRIALHEVLSPSDPYPLVVDNALVRYDDERLENTIRFLKDLSRSRQIILTTSDSRILDMVPKRVMKTLE